MTFAIEYHVEVNTLIYEIDLHWRSNYMYSKTNLFPKTFPEFAQYIISVHGQQNGFCCSFNDYEAACGFKRRMIEIYSDYVSIRIFSTQQRRNTF